MIYFLYGEDTYRSRAKIREIIAAFQARAGGLFNVTEVDAASDPERALEIGGTPSLFSEKELLIIGNALRAEERVRVHIERVLESWKSDRNRTAIFWESETEDEKNPLFGEIKSAAAKTQEFQLLPAASVRRWLGMEAKTRGVRVSQEDVAGLARQHGSDLWALSQELEKIRFGWKPTARAEEEEKIWNFTDAWLAGGRRAFLPFMRLLETGIEPPYLVGTLASTARTIAVFWQASTGKAGKGYKKFTARFHPFVIKKNTASARTFNGEKLRARFGELVRTDVEMKTGKLPMALALLKLILK